jgi:OOP family OmpA-OmpF porin
MKTSHVALLMSALCAGGTQATDLPDAPRLAEQVKAATCKAGDEPFVRERTTVACNFKPGSANLGDDQRCLEAVEPAVNRLGKVKNLRVLVQGFADRTGNAEKNKQLSFERASALRKYLVDSGVSLERVAVTGYGSNPAFFICDETTKGCDERNRRIEIIEYLCGKPKDENKKEKKAKK